MNSLQNNKPIVFFGTEDFSLLVLNSLINSGYNISAVVTKPDSKSGRGQRLFIPSVKKFALENNIQVWQPNKVVDVNEKIASLSGKPVGILVSFGKIIPKSTIDLFNPGIINVHPSLLPKYRGPSPIETAIINGDLETGVSIMLLSPEMDAGPVYSQVKYELLGSETQYDLYEQLAKIGSDELIKILPSIINETIKPQPQEESQASYCKLIKKEDGYIDPEKTSSKEADRMVRAYQRYPKAKVNILNHQLIITKSHTKDTGNSLLDIKCSDNKYLAIDELIAPSGRKMKALDFINGYLKVKN